MAVRLIQGKQITGNLTGSFTGSFTGNGSGLTNLPVQVFSTGSFVTTSSFNSFTSSYNTGSFTGSFTGRFTGSLLGTASQAISASWAPSIAGGSNTQIQFNSGSTLLGTGSFTFNYQSQSLQQGLNILANGIHSHAEGDSTIASGLSSHAEGYLAQTIGDYSHAEGYSTTATGLYSHAEGSGSIAIGIASHAEGELTETGIQTAFITTKDTGVVNGIVTLDEGYEDVTSYFTPGGYLYLYDVDFDLEYGYASFLIRTVSFDGTNTIVELKNTSVNTSKALVGDLTYLVNNGSFGGDSIIPGLYAHSEGESTKAIGSYSHTKGNNTYALGSYSHAEGGNTQAKGEGSHAEGDNTQSTGNYSHAEGSITQATGSYSHAEGQNTLASGTGSHTEGYFTTASGNYSHAEGEYTQAIANSSHAEGLYTIASARRQHVQGMFNITSSAEGAFILGNGSAENSRSNLIFAAGNSVQITGSLRVSGTTTITGSLSISQGITGSLFGTSSWATNATTASYILQAVSSSFATTASFAQNAQTASYVLQAVSSSFATTASFAVSSSISVSSSFATSASWAPLNAGGSNTQIQFNSGSTLLGTGSFTFNYQSQSLQQGIGVTASGLYSHAQGLNTTASGNYSHAEGENTLALGFSHAEGDSTIASGRASHAEGYYTVAQGRYQHVQGQYNISSSVESAFIIGNGTDSNNRSNLVFAVGNTVQVTGSLGVSGSITGSLFGTSSWASNAISASYAATASYSKNLQISGSINNVDYIDFNTGSVVTQPTPGRLSWNDTDGTLDIGLKGGNVTLQIGQEEVARVVNKTGANLLEADYRVVRVRSVSEGGAQGQRLAVVLAQADNDANSATTLGIVTEDINVNQDGFITLSGQVRGINTTGTLQGETWVDGDVLYLSPTTPGYLTKIKPQAPQHIVIVGYVEYAHINQGKIFVKVDNGYEIDELHNVRIDTGSLTPGQLLVRSGSIWINSNQLTGSYGLTGSLTATSFTGSLFGTSSWSDNATTASYVLQAVSSSFAATASFALNAGGGGTSLGLVQAFSVGLQNIF